MGNHFEEDSIGRNMKKIIRSNIFINAQTFFIADKTVNKQDNISLNTAKTQRKKLIIKFYIQYIYIYIYIYI